jgi:hypothetical protein
MKKGGWAMYKVQELQAYHQRLPGGLEGTSKGQRRKGEDSRGREIRGIGKRIGSTIAAHRSTKDPELEFEHVQFSLDKSKSLLTIQIQPKDQAESFISLIDSGATANFMNPAMVEKLKLPKISLSQPQNIRMLDRSLPRTGKVWHKVKLHFECQGLPSIAEFLVCPIGTNQAILRMPWLKDQNPQINWKKQSITLSEEAKIASEEEADKDPLKGLLEIYHQFAKVFGKEEFKVLPPHRPYDLAIDLKEGAKLHHGPVLTWTKGLKEVVLGAVQDYLILY